MPHIIISGQEGRIEGRFHRSGKANPPLALVLHPDPLHGGTMNNKVVYNLYRAFVELDFSVLRFNFRGVGRSEGSFDDGEGELVDAAAALDWLHINHPDSDQVWVSGFSFGAWIAFHLLMRRPEIAGFVTVSPPVNRRDFSFLSPCPSSGMVIQGDADPVVPEAEVTSVVERLSLQENIAIEYFRIKGADHFFEKDLDRIRSAVVDYVGKRLPETG